jgi:hypothetical protein
MFFKWASTMLVRKLIIWKNKINDEIKAILKGKGKVVLVLN